MTQVEKTASQAGLVGRGVIWITAAKVYFMLTGVALITLLPKLIGATDEERASLYGTFTVVIGVLNPITMMMITGTIQAVSKFISEDESRFGTVKYQALKLQIVFGGVAALLFCLVAPLVSDLLSDQSLTPYLRVVSIIIFCYAIYAAFIGCFNGRRMFFHQALMDIIFATLKVGVILVLAWLGFGVMGAVSGFALTAVIMMFVAFILVGRGERTGGITWKDILRFEAWIIIFALISNLLMNADLYLVKAFSSAFEGGGRMEVGIYSVALQVARLPFIAVISVTFVIFPLISQSTYARDIERTRRYIHTTARYSLILVALLAVTLSASSLDVLRLVFSPIFHAGDKVLALLSIAYLAYSFIMIFSTIISGSGKPWISVMVTAATLAISCILNYALIPLFGIDGAALGTLAAMLIGAVGSAIYVIRSFGAAFPFGTLIRLGVISAVIYSSAWAWRPEAKLLIVAKGAFVLGLFIALLFLFREIKREDLAVFTAAFRRKPAQ